LTSLLWIGFFDLYNNEDVACCATFGAHITSEQMELLKIKGVNNLILFFESDVIKAIKVSSSRAYGKFNIRIGLLPEGKDPGDMDGKEFDLVIGRLVDFINFNLGYVDDDDLS